MAQQRPLPPNAEDLDPSRLVSVGGPIDRACVMLRVFGESLAPDIVTEFLGCQPSEARKKGDVIPDSRYHRVARTGSWLLEGGSDGKIEIDQQITELLSSLTDDMQVWHRLSDDFQVDIFCGVFLEEFNRGFELSPHVLQALGERRIKLGFDIYGDGEIV